MTDKAISPLRQRMIEDMTIRKLSPKTQHDYVQRVKNFENAQRQVYEHELRMIDAMMVSAHKPCCTVPLLPEPVPRRNAPSGLTRSQRL
jgi:hypothetical protein